jgi:hypothetical protein
MTSDYEWEGTQRQRERERKKSEKSIKGKSLLKNGIHIDRAANCPFIFNQGHHLYVCNEAKSTTEN